MIIEDIEVKKADEINKQLELENSFLQKVLRRDSFYCLLLLTRLVQAEFLLVA